MAARIRKGDIVVVISGKDKGKPARSPRILAEDDRVVVEGINLVKRHTRPTPRNPQGGIIEREQPIHACKVMPVDPKTGKGDARPLQDARGRQEGSHRGEERRGDPRGRVGGVNESWRTRRSPRARSREAPKAEKAGEKPRREGRRQGRQGRRRRRVARPSRRSTSTAEAVAAAPARASTRSEVVPALTKQFSYKNPMQVPRLQKIVVNMGLGAAVANPKIIDTAVEELRAITGQKPVVTRAKKAIANFKLREGIPIGAMVTLRASACGSSSTASSRVALPRTRDFKGVSRKAFDGKGNYTLGLKEQIIFPEINYDKIDEIKGLNISFVTTATTDEEGRALLQQLGMPFRAA